jgi:hypothetical protein
MKMSSRTRVLLIAPILAAGIFAAGTGPASAAALNPNANCVGQAASDVFNGRVIAFFAQQGLIGPLARSNCAIVG